MATVHHQLVIEDALSAAARAVILDPQVIEALSVDQLLQVGRELRPRQPQLALHAHALAARLAKTDGRADALVSLAATQRQNGAPADALDSISEALELSDSEAVGLRANTCRVGAFRDLGQLTRARALGEQLETTYPDDPKVLRVLAAVYRELDGDDPRATELFLLADELDALVQDDFMFRDLKIVTPELDALLDRAARVAVSVSEKQRFCAFERWRADFRPELEMLASSQRADPRLRSERAYGLVALLVYRRLPPCRDCGRLYRPQG